MALPDLSRLAALGTPPLTTDTLAGVVNTNQQNGRWTLSQVAGAIGTASFSVINVRDYGATGNGSTDDRAAIQNAIDAAFGPASAPHGTTNRFLNKPVYFPAGDYLVSSPLYLTNVVGGWIFGASSESTRILYSGSLNGNAVIPNPTATITASISSTNLIVTAVTLAPTALSDILHDVLSQFTPGSLGTGASIISASGVTVGTTMTTPGQTVFPTNGTHGVSNGTTTFVDATANAFTSAMVGFALRITSGAGAGLYRIRGFTSASTVTLNGGPLAASGASWQIEGYTGTYTITPSQTVSSRSMNVAAPGSEVTPLIMTNGLSYSTLEKLTLFISGANTASIYYFQDGLQGASTSNLFENLNIGSGTYGVLAGYQSQALCSEVVYLNVFFSVCARGLEVISFNALDHNVFGGGANGCTFAAYCCEAGQINTIQGTSLAGNAIDFLSTSNTPMSIIGGRSEGAVAGVCAYVRPGTMYMSGFLFQGRAGTTFVDATQGFVVLDACGYAPGAGSGVIVAVGSAGQAIIDGMVANSGVGGTITGSAGSKVYLRGCRLDPSNATAIASYTGTMSNL